MVDQVLDRIRKLSDNGREHEHKHKQEQQQQQHSKQ